MKYIYFFLQIITLNCLKFSLSLVLNAYYQLTLIFSFKKFIFVVLKGFPISLQHSAETNARLHRYAAKCRIFKFFFNYTSKDAD